MITKTPANTKELKRSVVYNTNGNQNLMKTIGLTQIEPELTTLADH